MNERARPQETFIAARPKGVAPTPPPPVPTRQEQQAIASSAANGVSPRRSVTKAGKQKSDLDVIEEIAALLTGVPRKRRKRILAIVGKACE